MAGIGERNRWLVPHHGPPIGWERVPDRAGEGEPSGAWGGWRRFVVAAALGSVELLLACEPRPGFLGF